MSAGIDWKETGTLLAGIGAAITTAWAWFERRAKTKAAIRADVAESNTETLVLDSQGQVYKMLSERLTTLESEVRSVREELNTERQHSRKLELHIWKLENLMRTSGLEPPAFGA